MPKKSNDSARKPETSLKSIDSGRETSEQERKSKGSPSKKLDFPEAGLRSTTDLKETFKKEGSKDKVTSAEGSLSQSQVKPTVPALDAATLKRIEMEECMIGLRKTLSEANNRFLFLKFCEERVKLYNVQSSLIYQRKALRLEQK